MKNECNNERSEIQKNKEKKISNYNEMNATYFPFMQKTAKIFNISDPTLEIMAELAGDIEVSLHLGRKLPTNFTDDDLKNIRHLNDWMRQFEFVDDVARAKNKYRL